MAIGSLRSALSLLVLLAGTAHAQPLRGELATSRATTGTLRASDTATPSFVDVPAHRYTLPTRAGTIYQIDLASDAFDTFLLVLEGDPRQGPDAWTQLVVNDDGGEGTNSRARVVGTGRPLIVLVSAFIGEGEGPYTLRVTESAQTLRPVSYTLAQRVGGTLDSGSFLTTSSHLADVYTIALRAGQEITFEAESEMTDMYLEIYGSLDDARTGNNILAADDDSGVGTNARLAFTAPRAGTYAVVVRPFSPNSEGAYELASFAGLLEPHAEEYGDEWHEEWGYGGEEYFEDFGPMGWEEYTGDEPVVSGTLTAAALAADPSGARVTFDMVAGDSFDALVTSEEFDTVATILDAAGNEVAYNDDSGHGEPGTNSFVAFVAEQSGRYTLLVRSFGGTGTGAFRVQHRGGQNLRVVR